MDCDLPDDFELIVVGTGMIESIIAAAASRIGKKVLHVDNNDFYGGVWASFNLEGMDKYVINQQVSEKSVLENNNLLKEGEQILKIGNKLFGISNVSHEWHINKETLKESEDNCETVELNKLNENESPSSDSNTEIKIKADSMTKENVKWTQEMVLKNSRKFNLDLAPKLQFARGDFVELLISSNIARYSEYRSVSRVLTWLNEQLEVVPCSRSDVFSNTRVSVVEKRMLMKLLTTCTDGDESQFNDYHNKTFFTYLKDKKLTPNLIHYVLYAISMSDQNTPCLQGIENTKRFLNSLGRFGKTPFLYSMYGSGELPQAFCRLCAVFGGTYCLNRSINSLIIDANNKCCGIVCDKQRINAEHVVMSIENIPEKFASSWNKNAISRATFITDKSIFPCEKENLTLLLFPPTDGNNSITVIELGQATGTCPPDLFVIHMYCKQKEDPKKDLEQCVKKLFNFNKESDSKSPNVLWSLYFTILDAPDCKSSEELPENIFPCNGPDLDLDYDESVKRAKEIFMKMYPDCEFLPRAPDPEEIILCDGDAEEAETLSAKEMLDSDEAKDDIKETVVTSQ